MVEKAHGTWSPPMTCHHQIQKGVPRLTWAVLRAEGNNADGNATSQPAERLRPQRVAVVTGRYGSRSVVCGHRTQPAVGQFHGLEERLRTIQPWGDGGQESMGPNRLRRAISTTASGAGDDLTRRLNVCGRPLECKHVVRTVRYAVRCSLMSDLSILALHSCRGPVWRCADRVRTLWRARSPCIVTGFPNPVSLTAFPYPSSDLPTFPASSMRHPPHHPPHLAEDVDVPGEA